MKKTLIIISLLLSQHAFAQHDKLLTPTPPMGWNSWNWFGKQAINEDNMRECMDAIVEEGLLDAGYEYFVIDGGWRDTHLKENGELLANPDRFPNGIKALADYAHSRGLKFGLHTVPGTADCGGDPVGGFGHEEVQIKQFVDWGLDFIKIDRCRHADGWNEELIKKTYEKWNELLHHCGRDIVLSISAYEWRDWYPEVGQMARTTLDIGAKANKGAHFDYTEKARNYLSVMEVAEINNEYAQHAGTGYWNDPDMLSVGKQGLSFEEQKVHFALWCIMSSPLILGNDPRNMTPEEKEMITNELAISVNQDPTEQGRRIKKEGKTEIWMKNLQDGKKAVLLINRDTDETQNIDVSINELGLNGKVKIIDIYMGKRIGKTSRSISIDIQPQSGLFLLIG